MLLCHYTSIAAVVNQAFGDGDKSDGGKDPERVDLGNAPSYDMALANINNALNFG